MLEGIFQCMLCVFQEGGELTAAAIAKEVSIYCHLVLSVLATFNFAVAVLFRYNCL